MATLVFTALGTALGGPLGGALGSLVGNQLDRAIAGSPSSQGPRLKELSVTTSSYGTTVPRHYGTMRSAGSIIWSTDLVESSEESGGGKGRPATATYSYSISFAVALASRPIARLGRIWADGNLLRGAAGDLKTGGTLRVYTGHGDQEPDPIIAAQRGEGCPAFRDLAYCVFEGLQLAEFGNRIPALTFEIVADDGEVTLTSLIEPVDEALDAARPLENLAGFSDEGGPLTGTLAVIDQVYPLALDAGGDRLTLRAADEVPAAPIVLPEAAVDPESESFGTATGSSRRRQPDLEDVPEALRYYDIARDYQAGLQRPVGRAHQGRQRIIEFPGALESGAARALADAAAERASWAHEAMAWRTAELNPAIAPGTVVRVPGHSGFWRVETWEWRERGVELELRRLPRCRGRTPAAQAGEVLSAPDLIATPTHLAAFEVPPDSVGGVDARRIFVAASSSSKGWKGAALYLDRGGDLVPLGSSGSHRAILGTTQARLAASSGVRFEAASVLEVQLVSEDFQLVNASPDLLAGGANRAIVGGEIIQFARAERLTASRWRLSGLLRGRAGTEPEALRGHQPGESFVLLNEALVALDAAKLDTAGAATIAAIGLADPEPVTAAVVNPGASLRPPPPVHPRRIASADDLIVFEWTRRARGAWIWAEEVETPLVEPNERYIAGIGDVDQPVMRWELERARLELSRDLVAAHSGRPLWVRQVGLHAVSDALLLTLLP